METTDNCAWYEHPKDAGPICSKFGADYAKAEAIKQHGKADSKTISATGPNVLDNGFTVEAVDSATAIEDPALEKIICLAALPAMLAFAFGVQLSGFGTSIQRITFTMPAHAQWLGGNSGVPAFDAGHRHSTDFRERFRAVHPIRL